MADYRLSGYTTQAPLSITSVNNCGNIRSFNAIWGNAKGGSNETQTTNNLTVSVVSGSQYDIKRSFINFIMPSNLSRLDNVPQLKIKANSVTGDDKVFITSIDYTNAERTWSDTTAANAWDSAQTGLGAIYYQDGANPYATISVTSDWVTLDLNELAKFHCVSKTYVTIALLSYTYDQQISGTEEDPIIPSPNEIIFDDLSDANPPILVLQKPWFINDRGDELAVDGNFVIAANDVGVNQFDRSVPQLPFSQNIRGPRSLRGKNVPYKVTS